MSRLIDADTLLEKSEQNITLKTNQFFTNGNAVSAGVFLKMKNRLITSAPTAERI